MKNKFEFHSKSSTLKKLKPLLKNSKILDIFSFTLEEWVENPQFIIEEIKKKFKKKIIIRSSAIGEDSESESQAGKYLSISNIDPKNTLNLKKKIIKVINSYQKKNFKNEILIQPMLTDVSMSGVIFTYDNENGSPYYCIEYDDLSGSTDSVTSGINDKSRTLYILRDQFNKLKSRRFLKLIKSIQEVENLTLFSKLDIEFALNKKEKVFIFQVRPLIINKTLKKKDIEKINENIKKISNEYLNKYKKKTNLSGLFGVMPDWNPAEIIGIIPQPLSTSLYSEIITNDIWAISRKNLGYKNLVGNKLMTEFLSHPYINIKKSFFSFLPSNLNSRISRKLIKFWCDDIKKNGQKHDKIEFEVCTTCYNFDTSNELKKYKNILNNKEIKEFKKSLFELTRNIIEKNNDHIEKYNYNLQKLENLREQFIKIKQLNYNDIKKFILAIKKYGTLTFANSARIAFIAESILRSLYKKKIFSKNQLENFKNSINTVLGDFVEDTNNLIDKKISFKLFLSRYGHLRSGTYDILSKRYDKSNYFKNLSYISSKKNKKANKFSLSKAKNEEIEKIIIKNNLNISSEKLLDFLRLNISYREYSKFIFSKSLSEVIEKIAQNGKKLGLSREQLSYLRFKDVKYIFEKKKIKKLVSIVQKNRNDLNFNKFIRLPYLITKKSDFFIVPLLKGLPNFITSKKITSKITLLKLKNQNNLINLKNKIILIEKADPGYDWIFLHGISGLITKYGGSNSHMAIRCSELNIPAAIGCGDQLYKKLEKTNFLELDCFSKKIKLIN